MPFVQVLTVPVGVLCVSVTNQMTGRPLFRDVTLRGEKIHNCMMHVPEERISDADKAKE